MSLCALSLLAGCAPGVIGSWEASFSCGKWTLDVYDNFVAEAELNVALSDGSCLALGYDVVWEKVADGWEFDMDCDEGECARLLPSLPAGDPGDLSMYCVHPEEGDEQDTDALDCNVRQPMGFVSVGWGRRD